MVTALLAVVIHHRHRPLEDWGPKVCARESSFLCHRVCAYTFYFLFILFLCPSFFCLFLSVALVETSSESELEEIVLYF